MKIVSADFAYGPSGDHSVVMIGLADWQRFIARLRELRDAPERHYECEDPWYSCPAHPDCANDMEAEHGECTCRLNDKRNLAIELLALLGEE